MAYQDRDGRQEVGAFKGGVKKITVTVAQNASSGETVISDLNIETNLILFVVPALTSSHTAELVIQNEDNENLYASGEKAESKTTNLAITKRLVGDIAFKVETSASETAAAVEFTIYIYFN